MNDDLFPQDARFADWIAELERELTMRRRLYPRWVANGKMKQEAADRRIRVMEELLDYMKEQRG